MEWTGREEPTIAVDLWIGGRGDHELAMLELMLDDWDGEEPRFKENMQ